MKISRTRNVSKISAAAFTLVELMVSMAALVVIMLVLFMAISSSSTVWTRTVSKVQAFQGARAAFESMTRNLSQATLQSYYGYADSSGSPVALINPSFKLSSGNAAQRDKVPSRYLRTSELHFVSGVASDLFTQAGSTIDTCGDAIFFQSPIGFSDGSYQTQQSMLNVCGYYVQFGRNDYDNGNGTGAIPSFTSSLPNSAPKTTYSYRLMEVVQPADLNGIYASTNQTFDSDGLPVYSYDLDWIGRLDLAKHTNRHVLADNILLLVFLPKLAPEDEKLYGGTGDGSLISPRYAYDSRSWEKNYQGNALTIAANKTLVEKVIMNRLPPLVEVIMVAIDEKSAQKLVSVYGGGSSPPLNNPSLLSKLNLTDAFKDATKLQDVGGIKGDLSKLEDGLNSLALNYRIFQTEVRLPGASYGE